MKKTITFILITFIVKNAFTISPENLEISHIGKTQSHGSLHVEENDLITLQGSGADVWDKRDDFDFAAIPLTGDLQITARITDLKNCNNLTKAGIMVRSDLTPESIHAFMYYTPDMLCFHQRGSWRNSCRRNDISPNIELPYWLRLIRKGNLIISQRSTDGEEWSTVEIREINVPDTIYYGIAIASHDTNKIARASFDNLSITKYTAPLTHEMDNAVIRHHALYSDYLKDSLDILIGLPLNYDPDDAVTYPTAYHLDGGDNDDHYVIRNLMADNLVPKVITIGIGYVKSEHQRFRDYADGFDNFYLFVKNELIPFIDAHYKTIPKNRTLYGYSFGGLASMQTLFKFAEDGNNMPFQGIIAGSPSLWYKHGNGKFCFKQEANLHKKSNDLPINLYMCLGSEEGPGMVVNFEKMTEILKSRNYSHLNLMTVLNEGLNHDSNKRICFREGYLWLLNQPLP